MGKFTIIYRQRAKAGQNSIALHVAGCRDITRDLRESSGHAEHIEAENRAAAIKAVLQDLEDGGFEPGAWNEENIDTYPCCGK